MALRFVILMDIDEGKKVVMEYSPDILLKHLRMRIKEELTSKRSHFFKKYTKKEIEVALEKALLGLIEEFQGKSIQL